MAAYFPNHPPRLSSVLEVPSPILSDTNVCFDFPLIRVTVALNTHKTEH